MKAKTYDLIEKFFSENDDLAGQEESLYDAVFALTDAFKSGNKLLTAGNGGSAADAEHITGELIKRFCIPRPVPKEFRDKYIEAFGEDFLLNSLENGLPAISLPLNFASLTATLNDVGVHTAFAQPAYSLTNKGDVFLAISASGNSELLVNAVKVAKIKDATVILLSGKTGGKLKEYADISLLAPETETYRIQEYHIKLYHLLCLAVELEMFL